MESIILKALLDSLGFLFKEGFKSCLVISSILCSYICNYMVKIDCQWIKNIFCENVMKVKVISFGFIQAGSMWRTCPWLWVEVGWLLGCFSLHLLFTFETRKQKKRKLPIPYYNSCFAKWRVHLKVLKPWYLPARWAVKPSHLQTTFTSPFERNGTIRLR